MNILSFTGAVLFMCILIITVRQMKPEFSLLLSIACGAVLTLFLLGFFLPIISEIRDIATAGQIDSDLVLIALKAVGISILIRTASDVCRDAGQSALAGKLELGGQLALLVLALPLFRRILSLAMEIIGK